MIPHDHLALPARRVLVAIAYGPGTDDDRRAELATHATTVGRIAREATTGATQVALRVATGLARRGRQCGPMEVWEVVRGWPEGQAIATPGPDTGQTWGQAIIEAWDPVRIGDGPVWEAAMGVDAACRELAAAFEAASGLAQLGRWRR